MKFVRAAIWALALAPWAPLTQAATMVATFEGQGTVFPYPYGLRNTFPVLNGTTFDDLQFCCAPLSLQFVYDADSVPVDHPAYRTYYAIQNVYLSFGGTIIDLSVPGGSSRIDVNPDSTDFYGYFNTRASLSALSPLQTDLHTAFELNCPTSCGNIFYSPDSTHNFFGSVTHADVRPLEAATLLINSAAPEPSTWAILIIGLGIVGARLRRARRVHPA